MGRKAGGVRPDRAGMDFCDKHARVDPRAGEAPRVQMTRPESFGGREPDR